MTLVIELQPEACNALSFKLATEIVSRELVEIYGYRPLNAGDARSGSLTAAGNVIGTWRLS